MQHLKTHTTDINILPYIRPDILNLLLLEPGGSKYFRFQKFDLVSELMHVCT